METFDVTGIPAEQLKLSLEKLFNSLIEAGLPQSFELVNYSTASLDHSIQWNDFLLQYQKIGFQFDNKILSYNKHLIFIK